MKSPEETNDDDFRGSDNAELLTDSLLKNYAANPTGSDDDEFLSQVESAIDAECGGHDEFATTEVSRLPQPNSQRKRSRRLGWATGIAAVLAIGIGALSWNVKLGAVRQNPPQLVVKADGYYAEDSEIHAQTIARPQRRPSETAAATAGHDMIPPSVNVTSAAESRPKSFNDLAPVSTQPGDRLTTPRQSLNEVGFVFKGMEEDAGVSRKVKLPTSHGSFEVHRPENSASRYGQIIDNQWKSPFREPLSTFSIDVDTASWTNIRGMLERNVPLSGIPKDAVRIEEMINYFDWDYPQPGWRHPFGYAVESASCPWNENNRLLRVAIQGKEVNRDRRPRANLVFLLDVSGSMNQPNKLPLVKRAISILIEELNEDDRVSIVVYAGSEGVALHPTPGDEHGEILGALTRLQAGGSTNGGAGIDLAYRMAAENFDPKRVNRVILCTDGDFNVGRTGTESLVEFVERKARKDRIFLSVCGFGHDNLNDAMLEGITNKGNGAYYYIDSFAEARKVFLKDLTGTLVTIAKDVKIQIEFNPGQVQAYRLIGYANRQLRDRDFEDDRIDAGEIGAGHSVTAFYEIVPAGAENIPTETTSNLRYQREVAPEPPPVPKRKVVPSKELALLKLRYKEPDEDVSKYVEQTVMPSDRDWRKASQDFRFASAVALFGLKLRDHESVRETGLEDILDIASGAIGDDPQGYRTEFVKLLERARE